MKRAPEIDTEEERYEKLSRRLRLSEDASIAREDKLKLLKRGLLAEQRLKEAIDESLWVEIQQQL
jgi:hypothetical protein